MIIGTKTSHHGLNILGYRRATYSLTKGSKNANFSKSHQKRIELWIVVCNSTA